MRTIAAIVGLDEDAIDASLTPIDYITQEFGWLNQSGLFLEECTIIDFDDEERWARYINYLISWAFKHSSSDSEGESPESYREWCINRTPCSVLRYINKIGQTVDMAVSSCFEGKVKVLDVKCKEVFVEIIDATPCYQCQTCPKHGDRLWIDACDIETDEDDYILSTCRCNLPW